MQLSNILDFLWLPSAHRFPKINARCYGRLVAVTGSQCKSDRPTRSNNECVWRAGNDRGCRVSPRPKNDKDTVNDFELGLTACQMIRLLYKWGADGLQLFSCLCSLFTLRLRWTLLQNARVLRIRWIAHLGQWLFKSIIMVNEDTATGITLSHIHTHSGVKPRGCAAWCVFCEVPVMMTSTADYTLQQCWTL